MRQFEPVALFTQPSHWYVTCLAGGRLSLVNLKAWSVGQVLENHYFDNFSETKCWIPETSDTELPFIIPINNQNSYQYGDSSDKWLFPFIFIFHSHVECVAKWLRHWTRYQEVSALIPTALVRCKDLGQAVSPHGFCPPNLWWYQVEWKSYCVNGFSCRKYAALSQERQDCERVFQ